jgi:hypothetical protein
LKMIAANTKNEKQAKRKADTAERKDVDIL